MKNSVKVLLALVLVFTCLTQPVYAADPGQTGTIQYEGKKVQVSIGEIDKDDKGNTTVQILTNFEVVLQGLDSNTAMAAFLKVIKVKIVARNETFEASSFSIKAGGMEMTVNAGGKMVTKISHGIYHFDAAVLPEKIIIYNEQGSSLTFNGKTKKIIK